MRLALPGTVIQKQMAITWLPVWRAQRELSYASPMLSSAQMGLWHGLGQRRSGFASFFYLMHPVLGQKHPPRGLATELSSYINVVVYAASYSTRRAPAPTKDLQPADSGAAC